MQDELEEAKTAYTERESARATGREGRGGGGGGNFIHRTMQNIK